MIQIQRFQGKLDQQAVVDSQPGAQEYQRNERKKHVHDKCLSRELNATQQRHLNTAPSNSQTVSRRNHVEKPNSAMATTKRRQRRADVRTLVDAGFNVAWASDGDKPQGVASIPWTHPDYLPALMSRAAVTLCVDLRHDVAGYWSDRLWLALGAGACVVRRFTEGQPGLPYLSYTHRQ